MTLLTFNGPWEQNWIHLQFILMLARLEISVITYEFWIHTMFSVFFVRTLHDIFVVILPLLQHPDKGVVGSSARRDSISHARAEYTHSTYHHVSSYAWPSHYRHCVIFTCASADSSSMPCIISWIYKAMIISHADTSCASVNHEIYILSFSEVSVFHSCSVHL